MALTLSILALDTYIASIFLPELSKKLLQALPSGGPLVVLLIILGIFWTLEKALSHLQDIVFFPSINEAIRSLSLRILKQIHQLPFRVQQRLQHAEVISALKRLSGAARSFMRVTILLFIPTVCRFLLPLYHLNTWHPAAPYVWLGFLAGFIWLLNKLTRYYYMPWRHKAWQTTDQVTIALNDSFINSETIRFSASFEYRKIENLLNSEAESWYRTNTRLHLSHGILTVCLGLALTSVLILSLYPLQKGQLTAGDFILLKTQLLAALLPLKTFSVEFRQAWEAVLDIQKLRKILSLTPLSFKKVSLQQTPHHEAVSLTDIEFSYDNNRLIFSELNLTITDGDKIILKGESGSGKSTLARMITGLLVPHRGTVRLDGQLLAEYSPESLQQHLHYIPQEVPLYNGSIKDNLSYGLHAEDLSLIVALQAVGLEHLLHRPGGLDATIGERGFSLSGGERQRLALAKALILKPKILILDETTHSLDLKQEELILSQLLKNTETFVLITHRSHKLKGFDKQWLIQKGGIQETQLKKPLPIQHRINIF